MRGLFGKLARIQYELFITFILTLELIFMNPGPGGNCCAASYVLSYRYGLGSRFLVGSVIDALTDFVTTEFLWNVIIVSLLVLILLVAILFGKVIRQSQEGVRGFVIYVAAIFLASPVSISYLFFGENFGRFDTYLLILALLSVVLADKPFLRWSIPVLCLLGMATHQVFAFTFAPLVVVVLLYTAYRQKFNFRGKLLLAISFCALAGGFLLFQFFGKSLNVPDVQTLMADITTRSNVPDYPTMIEYEYFKSTEENFLAFVLPDLPARIVVGITSWLFLLPLTAGMLAFWLRCYRAAVEKGMRWIVIVCILLPLAGLPAFVLTADWGRWFSAIYISQLCLILYFIYTKEPVAVKAAQEFYQLIRANGGLAAFLLVYLTVLGKFGVGPILGWPHK